MPPESLPHPPDDETLAARARGGCAVSFEELVRRYQVPLLHFLRERGPEADAEDVLQETFIRAYQNLDKFKAKWRFSTWLFTIARRLNSNERRRVRSESDTAAVDSLPDRHGDPAERAADAEHRERLWAVAAEVLEEEQHTALWLFYVEEMPVKEIAKVLNRFTPSVKTMLHRARRKLMPVFERMESDGSLTEDAPRTSAARRMKTELNHG